jgi:hypothetical protein
MKSEYFYKQNCFFLAGHLILTLYILSDCYLGLDQQYDLHFDIIPISLQAQVNTELQDMDVSSDLQPAREGCKQMLMSITKDL